MESEGKAALLLLLINKRPRDQTPFELLLGVAQGLAGRDRAFPYEEVTRRIRPENLVVANNADSLSVQSIAAHAALAAQTIGLAPDLDTLHRQPFSTPTGLKGTVVWFYCSEAAPIAKPAFEHAQTPTPSEPGKKWWRFWK